MQVPYSRLVPRRRLIAGLAATLAFAVTLVGFFAAAAILMSSLYGWHHGADHSTGDVAAWSLIILSPLLIPVDVLLASLAAVAVYLAIGRRTPSK